MNDLLIDLAKALGVGGLIVGVCFIFFKKIDLTIVVRQHITLLMWLVWSFCIFVVSSYQILEYLKSNTPVASRLSGMEVFNIDLQCFEAPPGEGSELDKLFAYAEEHEGEIIQASISMMACRCPDEKLGNRSIEELRELHAKCNINPHWPLAKFDLNCVQSLNLVSEGSAGIASFCFPKQQSLPYREGYKRSATAVDESISGKFLVYYEWGSGAPHVQLVVPET